MTQIRIEPSAPAPRGSINRIALYAPRGPASVASVAGLTDAGLLVLIDDDTAVLADDGPAEVLLGFPVGARIGTEARAGQDPVFLS